MNELPFEDRSDILKTSKLCYDVIERWHQRIRQEHATIGEFVRYANLFIYLFFIYSWLTANEITVYNKNSYVYIHANWRQLPNVEKMKNCKINIKKKKKKKCIKS